MARDADLFSLFARDASEGDVFSSPAFRVEEADGVGEPCDTEQLSLTRGCSDSRLLRGLWASAVLLGPNG